MTEMLCRHCGREVTSTGCYLGGSLMWMHVHSGNFMCAVDEVDWAEPCPAGCLPVSDERRGAR